MNSLTFLAMINSSDSGGLKPDDIINTISPWVNLALGVLFGLLGLFCSVKCAIIGYHIAKSSDNPEARSEYVRSIAWPIIGLLSAVIVPTVVSVILKQVAAPHVGG